MSEEKKTEIVTKPEDKPKAKTRDHPRIRTGRKPDDKMKLLDEGIKKQQERLKDKEIKKEPKKETGSTVISGSVYDQVKKDAEQLPFVGWGGMWKAVTAAYNSCTDEFGKLTTDVGSLGDKIYTAQKSYFEKHFGKWIEGDQKIGRTVGDLIYEEYLGDIKQTLKPLEKIPKDRLVPKMISENILTPLAGHFNEKIAGLHQKAITDLGKDDKEKLKDELVYRAQQLGRTLTKAELISGQSLVRAVYGIIDEERKTEYEGLNKGKPLFEGLS